MGGAVGDEAAPGARAGGATPGQRVGGRPGQAGSAEAPHGDARGGPIRAVLRGGAGAGTLVAVRWGGRRGATGRRRGRGILHAVGEGEGGGPAHVVLSDGGVGVPRGEGPGAAVGHEVRPAALRARLRADPGGEDDGVVGDVDAGEAFPGRGDALGQGGLLLRPAAPESVRVGVEGDAAAHDLGPFLRIPGRHDVHGEAEAVEELRPELALLGVHGAHEEELGGMHGAHALAFHPVHPGGGHVEEDVHEVVGKEVHLVHVQDAPVRLGDEAGGEAHALASEGGTHVDRAHEAVLGGAEREVDEAHPAALHRVAAVAAAPREAAVGAAGGDVDLGQETGKGPYRRGLRRAPLAPQEDAADVGVEGAEHEAEAHRVLPHDRRERERGCRGSAHDLPPRPSVARPPGGGGPTGGRQQVA